MEEGRTGGTGRGEAGDIGREQEWEEELGTRVVEKMEGRSPRELCGMEETVDIMHSSYYV